MSVLLLVVGAIAAMVGVAMVGYGIPINEFSFGNTLIIAGTTAVIGGLIVVAIGAAVVQLQRIAEMLAKRAPARTSRPADMFEMPAGSHAAPAQGRIPFPPKPKSDSGMHEPLPPTDAPAPTNMAVEGRPGVSAAPRLRNPDMPEYAVEEYEEAPLSPRHPMAAPVPVDLGEPKRPVSPPLGANGSAMAENRPEPAFDAPWRSAPAPQPRPPQTSYFDSMWPADSRHAKRPASDEATPDLLPPKPVVAQKPYAGSAQAVAILKSGVVDGMSYTLYVDGSIEAELPQGILRFASINELRSHLTKNA